MFLTVYKEYFRRRYNY